MSTMAAPYAGTRQDQRDGIYPDDTTAVVQAFDREVLPHLVDPALFMALEPIVRLRATVDFVTVHPHKHDQSVWARYTGDAEMAVPATAAVLEAEGSEFGSFVTMAVDLPPVDVALSCGTSHCLAGWGCHFAAYRWATQVFVRQDRDALHHARESLPNHVYYVRDLVDGTCVKPSIAAAEVFRIDVEDASVLFGASRTLAELREGVAALECGEELRICCSCGCEQ